MKNLTLDEVMEKAKKAKGYLVTITIRGSEKEELLHHYEFTKNFLREDIYQSMDEHANNLEPQTKVK